MRGRDYCARRENILKKRVGLGVCLVLGLLAGWSLAQDADAGRTEKAENDKDEKKKVEKTVEVVVTATKTEADSVDVPVNVEAVNIRSIETKTYSNPNVGEVVRDLPGVSVGHGNRNIPPWIHLRGTGYFIGRTLYMTDEQPLAEPMVSIAANPLNLSAVEVLLGPSSSLYGPNASGGVVNMRSVSARERSGITVGASYGTFNSVRPNLSVGKVLGNWDLYGSFTMDKSDGYKNTDLATGTYLTKNGYPSYLNYVNIENQSYTNDYFYGRIGYLNPASGIRFTAGAHVFTEDLYGGKANSESSGTRVIGTGSLFVPISGFGTASLRFGYQSRLSDGQSTKGAVAVANSAINERYVFAPIDENRSYIYDPTITQTSESTYTRTPLDLQADLLFLKHHTITAGASYIADRSRSEVWNAAGTATLSNSKYDIGQTAFYLQDQFRFLGDKAILLTGIRYDLWKYDDIYDSGSTNKTPPSVSKDAVTYRGAFKYRLTPSWGIRTSFGTAFWPGAATWFYQNVSTGNIWREANPDLKPETTTMADLGIDYIDPENRGAVELTYYTGLIKDAMSYVYDQHPTLPGVQIIRTSNSDRVRIQGLQLGVQWMLVPSLRAFVSGTLNKSEITKSAKNKGHELRNAPDYFGSLGLIYDDTIRGIGAKLSGRFSDDRYYDDENTALRYFHMAKYFCLDAKVWKSFALGANRFTASLGVDNLTDKRYDGEFIYNAPGRFVEFNLSYHFDW
jgi:iron complex outermembrane recepter protein